MPKKVVIVGGGVAGLSAAHELIERGFEVHVYERRPYFGGKAASYRVPQGNGANAQGEGLPGEHGFRFFPGWYRHLTHTMTRIPYHRPRGGRRTVAENLVSVRSNLLASFERAPIALPLQLPSSIDQAATLTQFITEFSRLGLSTGEVALFFRKIAEFVIASDQKRAEALEDKTWWEFLECGKPGRSRAYQDLVRATTRTSVAAKAEEVSTYTIGRLVVRTLLDTMSTVDRVLNGPTNEVWIEPWVAYLRGRGVKFHLGMELESIAFDADSREVRQLQMASVTESRMRRLRKRVRENLSVKTSSPDAPNPMLARRQLAAFQKTVKDVEDSLATLESDFDHETWEKLHLGELRRAFRRYCTAQSFREKQVYDEKFGTFKAARGRDASKALLAFEEECDNQILAAKQNYERALEDFEAESAKHEQYEQHEPVNPNYFVLALPLEQLAYYVNRTTMLSFLAPELRDVIRLQRSMDWMAGIQFYFNCPLDLATGHVVGVDSDWALTAVEHTQFWDDIKLPSDIKAVLSVDIAAWNRKGRKIRKEAFHCTPEEIAEEVWAQLAEMMNRPNRLPILTKEMLVGGRLTRNRSYHLDESIVERDDRKKQAFYERARSLSFGLTGDLAEETDPADKVEEGFMWGERSLFNAEPMLINRAGTRKLRPEATTSIPNLFLAGDYVRTETDLACMEGANEAARLAVNGILEHAASREPPCELWPFSPTRQAMEGVMGLVASTQAIRSVADAVSQLPKKFWKSFGGGK
jgi:uncharacterized protein with NAD-binding domain and iron-sulfur cluster